CEKEHLKALQALLSCPTSSISSEKPTHDSDLWAAPVLPISIEDAARSEAEIESALELGEQLVRVNQDTRLNYRVLDIRTPANQGIFSLESDVLRVRHLVYFVSVFALFSVTLVLHY
ncbi:aspartate--tRNA ligase 2, cytoplasmic-like protein, partial [Tanacetum coccineum]